MPELATVRAYHQRSKHALQRYAAGPDTLDWDAQPNPWRRYTGAATLPLPLLQPGSLPARWDQLGQDSATPPQPCDLASLAALLQLALGLSAWKTQGPRPLGRAPQPEQRQPAPHRSLCAGPRLARPGRWPAPLRAARTRARPACRLAPTGAGTATGRRPRGPVGGLVQHPLARGLEVRRTRIPLLPARPGPCTGCPALHRRRAGLALGHAARAAAPDPGCAAGAGPRARLRRRRARRGRAAAATAARARRAAQPGASTDRAARLGRPPQSAGCPPDVPLAGDRRGGARQPPRGRRAAAARGP